MLHLNARAGGSAGYCCCCCCCCCRCCCRCCWCCCCCCRWGVVILGCTLEGSWAGRVRPGAGPAEGRAGRKPCERVKIDDEECDLCFALCCFSVFCFVCGLYTIVHSCFFCVQSVCFSCHVLCVVWLPHQAVRICCVCTWARVAIHGLKYGGANSAHQIKTVDATLPTCVALLVVRRCGVR